MRCNKCGEEYKENQAFCLKCGNPIHVVPDFNLIEAELANDVGALMDSDNDVVEVPGKFSSAEAMKTVNVPVEEISMELKMVDINRGRFNFEDDELALDEEEEIRQRRNENRQPRSQQSRNNTNNGNKKKSKNANSKKSAAKNILIMVGCIVAVTLVIVLLWKVVFSDGLNDSDNFQKQYNIAKEQYESNNKKEAIAEAKKAVKVAYSQTEMLRARKLLHDVYVHFEVMDEEYIDNLREIVKLDDSNVKYSEAILDYYYTNQKFDEFNVFFATLEGKGITENMTKYLPVAPQASLEGGHYDTFLTITLTATEGTTIYYTLDGSNPKDNSNAFVYADPIQLSAEGTTKIIAYAMDSNGIMSTSLEVTYIIEDVEVSGPTVSPTSGAYSDYQMVEVTVPEGSKVYYTTDGTDPTASSTEYTEPFDMPYGRTDYKFVSIDAAGNASSITSITYNLSLKRNVTVSGAETLVQDMCIEEKELDEDAKNKDGVQYKFVYKSIEILNNAEYYIIEVSAEDDSIESEYYAVNSNDETIVLTTKTDEGYTIPEEE